MNLTRTLIAAALSSAGIAQAGSLDAPAPPADAMSGMYTINGLYDRLTTGAAGSKRGGAFVEPAAGPASSTHTLNELMSAAPALNATSGATPDQVLQGKGYWGLQSGANWGTKSGTMPNNGAVNITPSTVNQTIAAGYHNGTGAVAGDADLVTGNIRAGVNLFGVAGDANVVNTASGDAAAGDLLITKKGWVDGAEVTGTMPNNAAVTIAPGATDQPIPAGYHNGLGKVTGDADLVTGNIRSGVNLFGVAGDANVVNTSSGDAVAGDVLATKKGWVDGAEVTGTMPNRGAVNIAPSAVNQTIAAGYHNGAGAVAGDADLIAGNIKTGVNLFGVNGSVIQASGAATAGQVLSGVTFSNAAGAGTGTMPNIGTVTITPGTAIQAIAAGYHNGSGSVAGDADLTAANIKSGVQVFGVTGSFTGSGGGTTYNAGVPRSGQTLCYDTAGTEIACAGTGQDGDLQKGVAWSSPRFTDNGNGTVTDNLSGLIWLKNADCITFFNGDATVGNLRPWANALTASNSLANGYCGLTDGSTAGQWRLPNVRELQSLIDFGSYEPALSTGNPFGGVHVDIADFYWSSTTYGSNRGVAWIVYMYGGIGNVDYKTYSYYVWPVRGP